MRPVKAATFSCQRSSNGPLTPVTRTLSSATSISPLPCRISAVSERLITNQAPGWPAALRSLDAQVEEMSGAGDARVVAADGLLAFPGELLVRKLEPVGDECAQVGFDDPLVLRGRRDDLRVGDGAVGVELVAMVDQAAWRLGAAESGCLARRDLDVRGIGRLVVADQPECFVARVEDLDGADDDAAERVGAGGSESGGAGCVGCRPGQTVEVQAVPGHGPDQVRSAVGEHGVQGGGVRNLQFGEVLVVFAGCDVKALAGDDASAGDRVLGGMTERDEVVGMAKVREWEGGHP